MCGRGYDGPQLMRMSLGRFHPDLEKALGKGTIQLLLVAAFALGHFAFYFRLRRYLRDPTRRFASGRTLDLDPEYFTAEGQSLRRAYSWYAKLGGVVLIASILIIQAVG